MYEVVCELSHRQMGRISSAFSLCHKLKPVLNWFISLVIFISISPLFLVYIPIILVVLSADSHYDNKLRKGETLFAIFKGTISIFKKVYNKLHFK